jgi:hypothetical protein
VLILTAIALGAPVTAAQAEPKDPIEPVEVHVLWPLCTLVLGTGVCVPP